ncbi:helix-turn-helix transcriptional regulator [Dyella sp. M7H15-1]|uniref:S24 family peptidase n=1 Tax=Dyella sp. M7H15-1 TaxID=2501295 RepID=UPI001004D6C0|nr:helix-turn-helix transcriptional regulator [Dyella sp. M7H15-1]QAU22563.1 helix-turn-helix transcriptional regulator [Dyella sp. M7H15-1]
MQTIGSLRGRHRPNHHKQMVDGHRSRASKKTETPFQKRFLEALEMLDISRAEFANLPGVTSQNLYSAFKREKVGEAHMARLRELAASKGVEGLTVDWLEAGLGAGPHQTDHGTLQVSALEAGNDRDLRSQSASNRALATAYARFEFLAGYAQERTRFIDIPSTLLRGNVDLLTPSVRVYPNPNDVMRGEIEKGDLVFVDTSVCQVEADGVYAYKIGGIPQIRRIQVRGKGVLRFRGTHAYEDSLELSGVELEDLEIGGRVIGSIGCRKF